MKVDRKPVAVRQLVLCAAYTCVIKSFASDEIWEG